MSFVNNICLHIRLSTSRQMR